MGKYKKLAKTAQNMA